MIFKQAHNDVRSLFAMLDRPSGQILSERPNAQLTSEIESLLSAAMIQRRIPGLCLAVHDRDSGLIVASFGKSSVELDVPTSPDTVFEIGSITKLFTATAISMLVEDGTVDLDIPIREWLTEAPPSWDGVTLRHLLSHTSGLEDLVEDPILEKRLLAIDTNEELLRCVLSAKTEDRPGERQRYNTFGFIVAALILERITGSSYDNFLRQRMFQPAGMRSTRLNSDDLIPGRASGHTWDGDVLRRATSDVARLSCAGAGGLLLSTARDLALWGAALSSGIFLSNEGRIRMWAASQTLSGEFTDRGLGWGVDRIDGVRIFGQSGGMAGFQGRYSFFPDEDRTVVVLTNVSSRDLNPGGLVRNVAATCRKFDS